MLRCATPGDSIIYIGFKSTRDSALQCTVSAWLSIKTITGADPAKLTESTEGSGPGLRKLTENYDTF